LTLCDEYVKPVRDVELAVKPSIELSNSIVNLGWKWPFITLEWGYSDWMRSEDRFNDVLKESGVNTNVTLTSGTYRPGEGAAKKLLNVFVSRKLKGYERSSTVQGEKNRSEYGSLLSPYLSHGFVSPTSVALAAMGTDKSKQDVTSFFISLARRELSYNFVWFNEQYDVYESTVPVEAHESLTMAAKRRKDPYKYTDQEWEEGKTHDPHWNSVQHELILRGRDIVQDRFYWCHKLIEYETDPKNGYRLALTLNDRYMVDATDPVGYKNVAECFQVIGLMSAPKLEAEINVSVSEELVGECLEQCGVDSARIRLLNEYTPRPSKAEGGTAEYVLYWSNHTCHREHNEALELAKAVANKANLPLVVLAVIDLNHYKIASLRHVLYFLEGLAELKISLDEIGARLEVRIDPAQPASPGASIIGDESRGVVGFESKAYAIITDRVHLKHDRASVEHIVPWIRCTVFEVETRLVIPLEVASDCLVESPNEFVDNFLRLCDQFLHPLKPQTLNVRIASESFNELGTTWTGTSSMWGAREWIRSEGRLIEILTENNICTSVKATVSSFRGGEKNARKLLTVFVTRKLKGYSDHAEYHATESNRTEYGSLLSPYLTHGFISPTEVALRVIECTNKARSDLTSFFVSLAKRELSYNFVYFNPDYDNYTSSVPLEVREKLETSVTKRKTYEYSFAQWEQAETHDLRWNAVQKELMSRGRDIVQDRFYWCLKLIEYESDPQNAFYLSIRLNDMFMLDASDPIGYKNVSEAFHAASILLQRSAKATEDETAVQSILKDVLPEVNTDVTRVRQLNPLTPRPSSSNGGSAEYVLYWAVHSSHTDENESLEIAKAIANTAELPLVVVYVIDLEFFKVASKRHVMFVLEGLIDFEASLKAQGINFYLRIDPPFSEDKQSYALSILGDADRGVTGFAAGAYMIVMDRVHLRHDRRMAEVVAANAGCGVIDVESRLIIPVEVMSEQLEVDPEVAFSKFLTHCDSFANPINTIDLKYKVSSPQYADFGFSYAEAENDWSPNDWINNDDVLNDALSSFDSNVSHVSGAFRGGEKSAQRLLNIFLQRKLKGYGDKCEQFGEEKRAEFGSLLSAYLARGFISPRKLAYNAISSSASQTDVTSFLKSLAKRELSYNFVYFNQAYDSYESIVSESTQAKLEALTKQREQFKYEYTDEQWEKGQTHDARWNAVQHELIFRGRDLVQDRFYWCETLIEFEKDPANAYRLALLINDKYMVDSCDPVGYKNLAECFEAYPAYAETLPAATTQPVAMHGNTNGNRNGGNVQVFNGDVSSANGVGAVAMKGSMKQILKSCLDICEVERTRVRLLNECVARQATSEGGSADYVLYWATGSFRVNHNEGFELAKSLANAVCLPLIVVVVVDVANFKSHSLRHVMFLLEGLADFEASLANVGVQLSVRFDAPDRGLPSIFSFSENAWAIVTDRGHWKNGRFLGKKVASQVTCPVIDVESKLVVPVEVMGESSSQNESIFMNQFSSQCHSYLRKIPVQPVHYSSLEVDTDRFGTMWPFMNQQYRTLDWLENRSQLMNVLSSNGVDCNTAPSASHRGGERKALELAQSFNIQPNVLLAPGSVMSAYLAFGFVSVVDVILNRMAQNDNTVLKDLSKRELACNLCYYSQEYDSFMGAVSPQVREGLMAMQNGQPVPLFQLEEGQTHNSGWNNMQMSLKNEGAVDFVLGDWVEGVLELDANAQSAFNSSLTLSRKLLLDSVDPSMVYFIAEAFSSVGSSMQEAPASRYGGGNVRSSYYTPSAGGANTRRYAPPTTQTTQARKSGYVSQYYNGPPAASANKYRPTAAAGGAAAGKYTSQYSKYSAGGRAPAYGGGGGGYAAGGGRPQAAGGGYSAGGYGARTPAGGQSYGAGARGPMRPPGAAERYQPGAYRTRYGAY